MMLLGARVDWLQLAYRVELDPAFKAALEERARVARLHGRASFSWGVTVPNDPHNLIGSGSLRRLGPVRAVWSDEEHVTTAERRTLLWGELRFSRAQRCWRLTNEPYFRLTIDEHAAGAPESGGPGFTVEITWYAQELAKRGIDAAIKESQAIAAMIGEVHEQRLRRIDLCADVEGFAIKESDVRRLVKRPRARWARHYDDGSVSWDEKADKRKSDDHGVVTTATKAGPKTADGPMRLTGISVGRGGDVMMRIYDKRAELERDADRRKVEEERWSRAGLAELAPETLVSRVEFQLRGEALRELGLRDPDCILSTVRDAKGRAAGQVVSVVRDPKTGRAREATLTDWIDRVWSTCLDWARLVSGQRTEKSATGRRRRVWIEDDRWTLLRTARFAHGDVVPIVRFRPRAEASAAMALGVTLSQCGREGLLHEWSEDEKTYADLVHPEDTLRRRLRLLKNDEVERIAEWLEERWGGAVPALAHLAIRSNAARARFMRPGAGPCKPMRGPREMAVRETATNRTIVCNTLVPTADEEAILVRAYGRAS